MTSQRGVVLVQVMVLALVLGNIAAMLIQFQYSRYITAYRVDTSQRSRAILQAALNRLYSESVATFSTSATPTGSVDVFDPVFGTCRVTIAGCDFDSASSSATEYCASFDPCSNCTLPTGGSPCFY